ncbi:hypothetical protein V8B97DRAFT_1977599 [Scleroderma yunnanense]
MSSRVQKGSTIFRPVTKTRARTTETSDRQPSLSQDAPQLSSTFLPDTRNILPAVPSPAVPPTVAPVRLPFSETADPSSQLAVHLGTPIASVPSRVPLRTQIAQPQYSSALENETIDASVEPETLTQETTRWSRPRSGSSTSVSKKARKSRQPTTPAFDADAGPGEELDPTSVTMATLCEDTGQGRVSSKASQILQNHLAWKRSNREKRTRMREMMEAKKYGRSEDTDATQENRSQEAPPERDGTGKFTPSARTETSEATGNGFDYSQNISTSKYHVQVRIGPNGETIIDEESLFVDRNAEEETANYTHVEESDVTKFINSGSYGKRFRGSRWSAEETELFYDALSQFGENYELISYVLPGRDRKACKNKFKAEDKRNPSRINYCLKNRRPYDIQTLSRMTGKDFSGPTPEIRPPAQLSLAEKSKDTDQDPSIGGNENRLPAVEKDAEEVLGDISSFDG